LIIVRRPITDVSAVENILGMTPDLYAAAQCYAG
jgi:hypothetical protein